MALMDVAGARVRHASPMTRQARSQVKQRPSWPRAIFGFFGTFFILFGIAAGLLTLRFALVLTHGLIY